MLKSKADMTNTTLFVDESGTLPDPKDKVIIVAAVGTYLPKIIETIITTVRKKGRFKKPIGEIKFYNVGEKTKKLFFKEIIAKDFDIFVLIIDKMGRVIPDTPKHFAILSGLLLKETLSFYPKVEHIVFDRHFHKDKDIEEFNHALNVFLNQELPKIEHVDSQKNKKVNIADMVAGAVLAKETGKDTTFYEIIKKKIISETKLNWPEAKRKLLKE